MGLKKFFLGFGFGIITLSIVFYSILGFLPKNEKIVEVDLSNDEIIERAKTLGMISIRDLPEKSQTPEPSAPLSEAEIVSLARNLGMIYSSEVEKDFIIPEEPLPTQNPEPIPLPEPEPEPTPTPTPTPVPTVVEGKLTGDVLELNIPYGANMTQVSRTLQQHGLVTDAADFTSYVINSGMSRRIFAGKRYVKVGSDYAGILNALTTR